MTRQRQLILPVVVVAVAGLTQPARGQSVVKSCGDGSGAISGVVTDARTGFRVTNAAVRVWGPSVSRVRCVVSTADGAFMFTGLPAGVDSVVAGAAGYRRIRPLVLNVLQADTQAIEIVLVPGTIVDECRDAPLCRDWLTVPQDSLRIEEQYQLLRYQVATVLAWKAFDTRFEAYVCVAEDTSPRVLDAFRVQHSRVALSSECALPGSPSDISNRNRLRHTPTGEPAYRLDIPRDSVQAQTERVVFLSHYAANLWGETWQCTFRHTPTGWQVRDCVLRGMA